MNRWASRNPEAMDEISRLPLSRQNEALRSAMGNPLSYPRCGDCGHTFRHHPEDGHAVCPFCGGHPKSWLAEEQE